MYNLGIASSVLLLILYPIEIIFYYYLNLKSGFLYLIFLYLCPILYIFQFRILSQFREGNYFKGIKNLRNWFLANVVIGIILVLENYILYKELYVDGFIMIILSYFIFFYWNSDNQKKYFDSLTIK